MKRTLLAVALMVVASAPAISQTMDEINAGIRARAATAAKGAPPEKIHVWDSGTVQLGIKKEEPQPQVVKSGRVLTAEELRCAKEERIWASKAEFRKIMGMISPYKVRQESPQQHGCRP